MSSFPTPQTPPPRPPVKGAAMTKAPCEESDSIYRAEITAARIALGEITHALDTASHAGSQQYMGWAKVTDLSYARIQLQDISDRLHRRGIYAPAMRQEANPK